MKKSTALKMRNVTLHLDRPLLAEVEALAERERRPISQLLRNIVADHIAQGRAKAADVIDAFGFGESTAADREKHAAEAAKAKAELGAKQDALRQREIDQPRVWDRLAPFADIIDAPLIEAPPLGHDHHSGAGQFSRSAPKYFVILSCMRRSPSSRLMWSTSPAVGGSGTRVMAPRATAEESCSSIQLLPSLGLLTSSVRPSGIRPGIRNCTIGNLLSHKAGAVIA
jgi:hypothetical protein